MKNLFKKMKKFLAAGLACGSMFTGGMKAKKVEKSSSSSQILSKNANNGESKDTLNNSDNKDKNSEANTKISEIAKTNDDEKI